MKKLILSFILISINIIPLYAQAINEKVIGKSYSIINKVYSIDTKGNFLKKRKLKFRNVKFKNKQSNFTIENNTIQNVTFILDYKLTYKIFENMMNSKTVHQYERYDFKENVERKNLIQWETLSVKENKEQVYKFNKDIYNIVLINRIYKYDFICLDENKYAIGISRR